MLQTTSGLTNPKNVSMSSLEMANYTGKRHSHLLESIRKMESAWLKVGQPKFGLTTYDDTQNKQMPCYLFNETEFLYIISKFSDEIRARLVLRWRQLEMADKELMSYQTTIEVLKEQKRTNSATLRTLRDRKYALLKKQKQIQSTIDTIQKGERLCLELKG